MQKEEFKVFVVLAKLKERKMLCCVNNAFLCTVDVMVFRVVPSYDCSLAGGEARSTRDATDASHKGQDSPLSSSACRRSCQMPGGFFAVVIPNSRQVGQRKRFADDAGCALVATSGDGLFRIS